MVVVKKHPYQSAKLTVKPFFNTLAIKYKTWKNAKWLKASQKS